jgi:cytochrome c peroxidase
VAFLQSLTGDLPAVQYPALPVRTDATPLPSLAK